MGQKYAAYGTSGQITGFYDSIDSPPPAGISVIEITDAQWQTCLSQPGWTVSAGVLTPPSSVYLVSAAKSAQSAMLQQSYQSAISAPLPFTNSAGVTSSYAFGNTVAPSGSNAQNLLTQIIAAGSAAWKAGVWFDTNGIAQTMTFADLQGLAAAIEAMETPDEQALMSKLADVQAATTVAAVQAIVW